VLGRGSKRENTAGTKGDEQQREVGPENSVPATKLPKSRKVNEEEEQGQNGAKK